MPQDAFTLKYLCDELNSAFSGGKINRIVCPDNDEVIFTIFTGKKTQKLFISVNPGSPRISIEESEKESPLTASNFCMLLRKHLASATIENISLVGFDRIVKISLLASNEFVNAEEKTLYVELMGRYSNVILTKDNKVLGCNRGINCFDNGVRPLICGKEYLFPPTNSKLLPNDIRVKEYLQKYDGGSVSACLLGGIMGLATSTASEIEEQFKSKHGEFDLTKIDLLFDFVNEYLYDTKPRPCVLVKDNNVVDVCVYPYSNIARDEVKYFDSLLEAEAFYFTQKERTKKFTNLKNRLTSIVGTASKKVKKKLLLILARERDAKSAQDNKIKGELILANIYKINRGDESVVLTNYYDNNEMKIALDKTLTPSQNAERYFKKYNKEKRTLIAIAPQKESAQNEIEYLDSLLDYLTLAENIDELVSIKTELEQTGYIHKESKKKEKKQSIDCREYEIEGFTVKVGRSNIENESVTFSAKPDDTWLHVKDISSSHVVIENNGKKIPDSVLIRAGEICAYYSKERQSGKAEVVYTNRKNVKKRSGGKTGAVIYENYKSIVVEPKNNAEFLKTLAKTLG